MKQIYIEPNFFENYEKTANLFNIKVGEAILNELNKNVMDFDMFVGHKLSNKKRYAKAKITFGPNFHQSLQLLKRYIDFSYKNICDFGYYEYHTILISLYYRIYNYWNEIININLKEKIELSTLPYNEIFLFVRSHWEHPENVHKDKDKKHLILVYFNKNELLRYSEVAFTWQEMLDDGDLGEIQYFGPYEMQTLVKASLCELISMHKHSFNVKE